MPDSPASVMGFAPRATATRDISASPRVMMPARELCPNPMPSEMPAAIATTFFSEPPISIPTTSVER